MPLAQTHSLSPPLFDWENNYALSGGMGRYLVSALLELPLGASHPGDLGHVDAHGQAQGPARTHCDHVTDLGISEAGGLTCSCGTS